MYEKSKALRLGP